jgi:uncharacterized membrane protein
MNAKTWVGLLLFALIALQYVWFVVLAPSQSVPPMWAASIFALPLAALLAVYLRGVRSAAFWAGVFALGYFCIGVMEAWSTPAARMPALLQTVLSALLVVACSWDGMRARFARKDVK